MSAEILTVAQSGEADRLAEAAGIKSIDLMENAGRAVADFLRRSLSRPSSVAVLCGPGNNGGDGFCAARHLRDSGCAVEIFALSPSAKGDAAEMARRWGAAVDTDFTRNLNGFDVIVDALFGAGLSRPLDGRAAEFVRAANLSGRPVVAVDVPSGLHGDLG